MAVLLEVLTIWSPVDVDETLISVEEVECADLVQASEYSKEMLIWMQSLEKGNQIQAGFSVLGMASFIPDDAS